MEKEKENSNLKGKLWVIKNELEIFPFSPSTVQKAPTVTLRATFSCISVAECSVVFQTKAQT